MKTRLVIILLAAALVALAASPASAQHAPPQAPCNTAHLMDLHITDDGVWFECVCEKLVMGVVCDWYELGPAPDATAARKQWRYVRAPLARYLASVRHSWPRYVKAPRRITINPPSSAPAPVAAKPASSDAAFFCNDPYFANDAYVQRTYGC